MLSRRGQLRSADDGSDKRQTSHCFQMFFNSVKLARNKSCLWSEKFDNPVLVLNYSISA